MNSGPVFGFALDDYRRTVPASLLCNGLPRDEIHIMTVNGLVIWYPDGLVLAPRATDGPYWQPMFASSMTAYLDFSREEK